MKRFFILSVIEILILAGGYAILCAAADPHAMLPGTTVNGFSIANMTPEDAAETLEDSTETLCATTGFTVTFQDKQYTVTVPAVFTFDYQSVAESALQSEQTSLPARGMAWLKSRLIGNHQKSAPVSMDMERFHQGVAASGLSDAVTASQKPYWMEDGQFFTADTLKTVDETELMEQISDAIQSGDHQAVIECPVTYDEDAANALKSRLFADQLATCTTRVSGSSNMVTNILLATEKCNGTTLLSGDIFSFNDTVGEQTAATGFKTADAILNGKIVQAYGGGICQVSTTIFAAALYANLEIVERWNHAFVSNYIGAGMDAAVAWSVRDFRIANNTDYPVRIEVGCSNGNLTVTLWGTKTDNTSVEIKTETLDSSTADTLEVLTSRIVRPGDGSPSYTEKISYSSYIR